MPDRKKETLEAYFATWPQAQRDAVEEVAMDLWEPYAHAVETCLPTARLVADRFHVMKNLKDQVSGARRDLQRDLPEEAKKSLKGCRWLLVRKAADLHPTDKAKLATMFGVAPALERLYRFKEEFRTLLRPKPTKHTPPVVVDRVGGSQRNNETKQVRDVASEAF